MKNAKLTISRVHYHDGTKVDISISDDDSGIAVIQLRMELEDFAQALMGLARQPAEVARILASYEVENLGKTLEIKTVQCPKVGSYGGEDQSDAVKKHFSGLWGGAEWHLRNDGCSSQQPGNEHKYTIGRYV